MYNVEDKIRCWLTVVVSRCISLILHNGILNEDYGRCDSYLPVFEFEFRN